MILVFDVSDYNSFKNLKKWLKDISQNLEKNIPLVLFANKVDLPKECWKVTDEQVKEFATKII